MPVYAKQTFCSRSCLAKNKISRPEIRAKLYGQSSRAKISAKRKAFMQTEEGLRQRQRSSRRMREDNPGQRPENVTKAMATKEAAGIGHVWLGQRGGNGKLTPAQMELHQALGGDVCGWKMELPILTGHHSYDKSGYPTNYKVDVGCEAKKVAVEIDGAGHRSKKISALDAKKTRKLELLGWRVLRFTNEAVTNALSSVLSRIKTTLADS